MEETISVLLKHISIGVRSKGGMSLKRKKTSSSKREKKVNLFKSLNKGSKKS